jgi:hypothetical protein
MLVSAWRPSPPASGKEQSANLFADFDDIMEIVKEPPRIGEEILAAPILEFWLFD